MTTRGKAIEDLKQLAKDDWILHFNDTDVKETAKAALALLKERETTSTAESRLFHCKKCGYGIDDIYLSNEYDFDIYPHYCPNCGRTVKWDG